MSVSTHLNITQETRLPAVGWEFKGPNSALVNTALKIAGYIPLFSLLVGVGRMLAFSLDDNLRKHPDYKAQIMRGALEAFQFTFCLFVVDLVVFAGKYLKEEQAKNTKIQGKTVKIN